MSERVTLEALAQTVEHQAAELVRLNERLEDLEDLRDLQEAMMRNGSRSMHAWEAVREELGLTDGELSQAASEDREDR